MKFVQSINTNEALTHLHLINHTELAAMVVLPDRLLLILVDNTLDTVRLTLSQKMGVK